MNTIEITKEWIIQIYEDKTLLKWFRATKEPTEEDVKDIIERNIEFKDQIVVVISQSYRGLNVTRINQTEPNF